MINRILAITFFILLGSLITVWRAAADIVMAGIQSSPIVTGNQTIVKADELLKPAIDAFRAGRMEDFKSTYATAAKSVEGFPALEIFTAKLQMESGRINDAIAGLDEFLIKDPNNPEGYLALGEIAVKSQRWTDAMVLLNRAKELCDGGRLVEAREAAVLPGLLGLRAEVAERRRQWDDADKLYVELIALKPEAAEPGWRRGRMLVLKGDVDAGIAAMTSARKTDAKLPSPEMTTALILAAKEDASGAEKWFQAAIKADRNSVSFWAEYLKWMLVHDRPSEVRQAISKLTPEIHDDRAIAILDGLTARYLSDFAAAETVFSRLHQANPEDLEAADQLALVLVESSDEGKRARAMQLCEANLRRAPNVENAVATAAWVHFKLGSVDVADRLLGELATKISLSPQTAFYVARVLRAKGNEADANKVLDIAVKSPGIFVERAKVKTELAATKL